MMGLKKPFVVPFYILIFTLLVVSGAGVLVFVQITLLGGVYITPSQLKVISGIIMLLWILVNIGVPRRNQGARSIEYLKLSKIESLSVLFFVVVLFFGLMTIVIFSSGEVGLANSLGAFLYNYSLFIFLLPFSVIYLSKFSKNTVINKRKSGYLLVGLGAVAIFSSMIQILQGVNGGPVLFWVSNEISTFVYEQQLIKFDHIGGYYRAQGVFRSPLEAGIVGVFVALCFLMNAFFGTNKVLWCCLAIFVIAGVVATGSRTGFLLLAGAVSSFLLLIAARYKFARVVVLKSFFLLIPFVAIFLLVYVYENRQFVNAMMNPTNLLIRFENWGELLTKLSEGVIIVLFGKGIVQNGNYGDYHSVVIDNTVIGMILTSGLFGFLFFAIFSFFWLRSVREVLKKLHLQEIVIISYLVGFALASFTENLMHYMFYPVLFYTLYSTLLINKIVFPAQVAYSAQSGHSFQTK